MSVLTEPRGNPADAFFESSRRILWLIEPSELDLDSVLLERLDIPMGDASEISGRSIAEHDLYRAFLNDKVVEIEPLFLGHPVRHKTGHVVSVFADDWHLEFHALLSR